MVDLKDSCGSQKGLYVKRTDHAVFLTVEGKRKYAGTYSIANKDKEGVLSKIKQSSNPEENSPWFETPEVLELTGVDVTAVRLVTKEGSLKGFASKDSKDKFLELLVRVTTGTTVVAGPEDIDTIRHLVQIGSPGAVVLVGPIKTAVKDSVSKAGRGTTVFYSTRSSNDGLRLLSQIRLSDGSVRSVVVLGSATILQQMIPYVSKCYVVKGEICPRFWNSAKVDPDPSFILINEYFGSVEEREILNLRVFEYRRLETFL